jgi:hypothetical protein
MNVFIAAGPQSAANQEGFGKMSDSVIFLFGAIMYLIGLGAMLFKDEFARIGLRLRSRRRA